MKKVLGYIFIVISIILALAIIGQFQKLIAAIINFMALFSFNLDSYDATYAITEIILWCLHFSFVIILWKYGRKWSKKPRIPD